MSLNPSQQLAVDYKDSHLLIIAGPGTGKTHTLTYRIAAKASHLNHQQRILAITFTNKAAMELKDRLCKLVPNILEKSFLGTFHSFCLMLLQRAGRSIVMANPDAFDKDLLNRVSLWKATDFDSTPSDEVIAYNQRLKQSGWVDFDDLILETIKLLRSNEILRFELHQEFPFIFVDEYQDVNLAQHTLLKLLVGETSQITAIGDPNQAIYGFRGSSVRFFDEFVKDFKNAKCLSLSDNYRSAQNILKASSQMIAKNESQAIPDLVAQIYDQGHLIIHQAHSDKAEAYYVVSQIEKMMGGITLLQSKADGHDQYSFGDIAILYRLNAQRNALEKILTQSGIPYQVFGLKPAQACQEDVAIPDFRRPSGSINRNEEKVSLMTLHAAKGLEFPVVFILGCEEDILPLHLPGLSSDIEEERRLFYVGMTRAKQKLYLVRAQKRMLFGKAREALASRFLSDIEETIKEYEVSKLLKRHKKDEQLNLFKMK